jgi:hypothetical protein
VRAVHAYLNQFGYFPNEQLAAAFPMWRPIVAKSPAQADLFDSATEQALRAFQRGGGLPETGTVDSATRDLLLEPRCGFPDGVEPFGGDEKFALASSQWSKSNLTWQFLNTDDGLTQTQVEDAARQALSVWAGPTQFTFTKSSSSPDIKIRFSSTDASGNTFASNVLGQSTWPSGGGDTWVNTAFTWSAGASTPTGTYDLQSLLAHELGHTIGISHSSVSGAIMRSGLSSASQRRFPSNDDLAAGFAVNLGWQQFDTDFDVDVAFVGHANGSDTYVVGGAAVAGGYQIWDLVNASQWFLMPGGAVHIAGAESGGLWVTNDAGNIFRWNSSTGGWDSISGCATDIAMGADGSVWIIGCSDLGLGHEIRKWMGTKWKTVPGEAVRISVGPAAVGKTDQVPWVVSNDGSIWRRTTSDPATGDWNGLPGAAIDIGVGGGTAWVLGTAGDDGGNFIYVYNKQAAGGGSPAAPELDQWIQVPGTARAISSRPDGTPFVVNEYGGYWPL